MERYLAAVGADPTAALALGDTVRAEGRMTVQPSYLPAVRLLEVGSDLALLARESGGPAWPGVSTRWRTDFALEQLAPMPRGHLMAIGQWEPVAGQGLRAAIHLNTYSDFGPPLPGLRNCSAYLTLLATAVAPRAAGEGARLAPGIGPSASALDQCRLTVRARVTDTYTVPNDRTGESVRILWLSAPGAWALQVAAAPSAVPAEAVPGTWVEAVGLLQGDLVAAK